MNAPRKQGAWGLWWLCYLTITVYYFVWYQRINRELGEVLGEDTPANGAWWNQLIPIWNLVGLHATAQRLNAAHAKVGSPTRVSSVMTWLLAPWWFSSHTRYLQRRTNVLHDVIAAQSVTAAGTPQAAAAAPPAPLPEPRPEPETPVVSEAPATEAPQATEASVPND